MWIKYLCSIAAGMEDHSKNINRPWASKVLSEKFGTRSPFCGRNKKESREPGCQSLHQAQDEQEVEQRETCSIPATGSEAGRRSVRAMYATAGSLNPLFAAASRLIIEGESGQQEQWLH
uniref:Uncharacterized protein n=1 Tax=Anopheles atroparvus TaxID=41427 RepID=A0A182JIP0_ANOAO